MGVLGLQKGVKCAYVTVQLALQWPLIDLLLGSMLNAGCHSLSLASVLKTPPCSMSHYCDGNWPL